MAGEEAAASAMIPMLGGGLLSSLFAGISSALEAKRRKSDFFERMGILKPGKEYSRGVDPVIQNMLRQTFANRGMANPYAMEIRKEKGSASLRHMRPTESGRK